VPLLTIIVDTVALDHLRLGIEGRIVAIKSIEYRERIVTGDIGGGPHRIQRGKVSVRNKGDRLGGFCASDAWRGQRCRTGEGGFEKAASLHDRILPSCSSFPALLMPLGDTSETEEDHSATIIGETRLHPNTQTRKLTHPR